MLRGQYNFNSETSDDDIRSLIERLTGFFGRSNARFLMIYPTKPVNPLLPWVLVVRPAKFGGPAQVTGHRVAGGKEIRLKLVGQVHVLCSTVGEDHETNVSNAFYFEGDDAVQIATDDPKGTSMLIVAIPWVDGDSE